MTSPAAQPAAKLDPAAQREERKRLRGFGLLVGGIFLLWGALRFFRHKTLGPPMMGGGGALLTLGLIAPLLLRLPYRLWMVVGHVLGTINTWILLFLSFWLLVVPFGLLRRIFAGSALDAPKRSLPDGSTTYFQQIPADPRGRAHFENMF